MDHGKYGRSSEMLGKLRDPDGNYTLLSAGIAGLALGSLLLGLLRTPLWPLPVCCIGGGIACVVGWWRQRRSDPYDLRRLFDAPFMEEEPFEPENESDGSPYCGWCDECYPFGTHRCHHCGRELG